LPSPGGKDAGQEGARGYGLQQTDYDCLFEVLFERNTITPSDVSVSADQAVEEVAKPWHEMLIVNGG
jgi:hypothetical protein